MGKYIFIIKRLLGYILGFFLFYEPFSYFYEILAPFFPPSGFSTIHVPCARVPLYAILGGGMDKQDAVSILFCVLLILVSIFLGPLFCGRLCPAGAFGEFLSHLVPEKKQLSWSKLVPVLPLRYGFLAGFIFSSYAGIGLPCVYCNYYSLELMLQSVMMGRLATTSLSLIATFLLAFIVLGMFSKGGRGYCNLLCPVGATSMLLHSLGRYLPVWMGMQVNADCCVGCGSCASNCPMQAITIIDKKAHINVQQCIICGNCSAHCPQKAICYGAKEAAKHGE